MPLIRRRAPSYNLDVASVTRRTRSTAGSPSTTRPYNLDMPVVTRRLPISIINRPSYNLDVASVTRRTRSIAGNGVFTAGSIRSVTPTAAVGTIGLEGPTTSGLMSQPQDIATTPTLSLTSVGSGISSTLGSVGSGVMNTVQSLIPIAIKLILLYIGVKVVLWLIRSRRR